MEEPVSIFMTHTAARAFVASRDPGVNCPQTNVPAAPARMEERALILATISPVSVPQDTKDLCVKTVSEIIFFS